MGPGDLGEPSLERDDSGREIPDVSRLCLAPQRAGDRHGGRGASTRHVLADLGGDGLGERTTATQDLDDPGVLVAAVAAAFLPFGLRPPGDESSAASRPPVTRIAARRTTGGR